MTKKVTTTEVTQYMVDNANMITVVTKSINRDLLLAPLDLFHRRTTPVEKTFRGEKGYPHIKT